MGNTVIDNYSDLHYGLRVCLDNHTGTVEETRCGWVTVVWDSGICQDHWFETTNFNELTSTTPKSEESRCYCVNGVVEAYDGRSYACVDCNPTPPIPLIPGGGFGGFSAPYYDDDIPW